MNKPMDFTAIFNFRDVTYRVRPAVSGDMEILRQWKNANTDYFHHKEQISAEQQQAWFASFKKKLDQQMFVCDGPQGPVACVGFRGAGRLELFNLICGDSTLFGTGFNATFFSVVRKNLAAGGTHVIFLEVLKSNTRAVAWYLKQGFRRTGEKGDAELLELALS
jgi:RimJ/RimL family protein N-acetyltransferase